MKCKISHYSPRIAQTIIVRRDAVITSSSATIIYNINKFAL